MKPHSILTTILVGLLAASAALGSVSSPRVEPASNEGWVLDSRASDILLIETTSSEVDSVLNVRGVAYDAFVGSDWDGLDLSSYAHVFVAMDGGSPDEASIMALRDYADAGGALHMLGGSSFQSFSLHLDAHLLDVDTGMYSWVQNAIDPDVYIRDDLLYLGRGLLNRSFVDPYATFYCARITDVAVDIAAVNGDGHPVLVTKPIGAGRLDYYIYSPGGGYYGGPGDLAYLDAVVGNMLEGPSGVTTALIGNARQYVADALDDLGVPFEESTLSSYTELDFSPYTDLFVTMDGFTGDLTTLQMLADFAGAGGRLHMLGGSSFLAFNQNVNTLLLETDIDNYSWVQNAVSPDCEVTIPLQALARGLAATYEFVSPSATWYQLRVTDPEARVAATNGDGHPVLVSKTIGNGLLNLSIYSPNFYTDPDDYAWLVTVVRNMLDFGSPVITAVDDIPGDQGGAVRLSWTASAYDSPAAQIPVTGYAVWRMGETGVPKAYPPGQWDYVATIPARGEALYQAVVPTLCDSTAAGPFPSSFFVSATTADPFLYFDSGIATGQSVDNLAPTAPTGLLLAGGLLSWDEAPEADFDYFTVYASDAPDLSDAVVLGYTVAPGLDVSGAGSIYVLVTATDFAGNEGHVAMVDATTGVDAVPATFRLLGAAPNPFNPRTKIRFDVPGERVVNLRIYDASGRLVRELLRGLRVPAGRHNTEWDGLDASGRTVSAGVYFYTLITGEEAGTGRMVLVK